ncbi:uncharacterized protein EV422DRAFT_564045 [Fimicolochytrium jonesii]|uniref:uncharacterized protein n=1 Tax=Fimicolochytrium jonesii TaxID=1396493 RepID=UPI0022FE81AD|nr:uncharacterized protein EV422DRAFT_564045 [Fimicolochytrium jonesii]KAI8826233.1 hypothetical protein EV422DRAFT_564045 [Fimicolochytrium jonesii]
MLSTRCTSRVPSAASRRSLRLRHSQIRPITDGRNGIRAAAPQPSTTLQLQKGNTPPAPHPNDRLFAHAAFFAEHRPLNLKSYGAKAVVQIETARRGETAAPTTMGPTGNMFAEGPHLRHLIERIGEKRVLALYNDEYCKIFGTVPYSTPLRTFGAPHYPTGPQAIVSQAQLRMKRPKHPLDTVSEYIASKRIAQPLPSSLSPPPSSVTNPITLAKQAVVDRDFTNPRTLEPVDEDTAEVLACMLVDSKAQLGLTEQQMLDTFGPENNIDDSDPVAAALDAFQMGPRVSNPTAASLIRGRSGRHGRIYKFAAKRTTAIGDAPASTTEDKTMHAISILKRRRKAMNKHKLQKRRKAVRNSTKYNKERRKKGGAQREKQE